MLEFMVLRKSTFCSQMSTVKMLLRDCFPCPLFLDLPLQESPDSSTSSKLKLPSSESEEGGH